MAAKNKSKSRRAPAGPDKEADFRDVFALHIQASCRLDELLEQVQALRAAGKMQIASGSYDWHLNGEGRKVTYLIRVADPGCFWLCGPVGPRG
ncbi:MAG: hypothetical protein M3O31_00990 [Acidobacteriota bacterium]|nr:hypothetical protein [Acidobacteriota bacterium]